MSTKAEQYVVGNANKHVKTRTKTIISSLSGFTKAKKQNSRPLLHLEWKLRRLKWRKSSTYLYFAACKGRQSKCIQALRTNQRGSDRFSCRALPSSPTQTQTHEIDQCNKWNRLWWYKIYELVNAKDGKSQKKAKLSNNKEFDRSVLRCHNNEFIGSRALELIRREQGTSTMFNMADFGRGGAVLC